MDWMQLNKTEGCLSLTLKKALARTLSAKVFGAVIL